MEKPANSATAALHERDELQKRLKINVDKQQAKAAAQAKKPRHKIPAEGLQFANHAELQAHFLAHHLENLANAKEKIRHVLVQGKVKKAEEKIAELVAKYNKHSERLAVGKLPAKWHMPSRIEGDMGKEHSKLDELQAELRKLEIQASHIQHSIDHGPGSEDELGDEEGSDTSNLDVGNLSLGEDSSKEVV